MKTIVTLSLFFLISYNLTYAQSEECLKNIRTGTFEYVTSGIKVTVIRTENEQIELLNEGKSKAISKVRWINNREYIITFVKSINLPGCLKEGDEMKMVITECNGNTYTTIGSSERCGNAGITITKIQN